MIWRQEADAADAALAQIPHRLLVAFDVPGPLPVKPVHDTLSQKAQDGLIKEYGLNYNGPII